MAATPRHVVFGTGAIGLATLDALRRRGESVRLVNRSGTAPVPDDIEVLGGDASDPAFTAAAAGRARCPRHPARPGPGRHPGHLPNQPSSVNHRDSGGRCGGSDGRSRP